MPKSHSKFRSKVFQKISNQELGDAQINFAQRPNVNIFAIGLHNVVVTRLFIFQKHVVVRISASFCIVRKLPYWDTESFSSLISFRLHFLLAFLRAVDDDFTLMIRKLCSKCINTTRTAFPLLLISNVGPSQTCALFTSFHFP